MSINPFRFSDPARNPKISTNNNPSPLVKEIAERANRLKQSTGEAAVITNNPDTGERLGGPRLLEAHKIARLVRNDSGRQGPISNAEAKQVLSFIDNGSSNQLGADLINRFG